MLFLHIILVSLLWNGASDPTLPQEPQELFLHRYDFVLQFCWQPRPAGQAPPAPPPVAAAAGE